MKSFTKDIKRGLQGAGILRRGIGAIAFFLAWLCGSGVMSAYDVAAGPKEGSVLDITVEDIRRTDNGRLVVDLGLNTTRVKMKSQMEQVYTPYIYNGEDTVRFESFSLTGHKRLLSNERNHRLEPVTIYKNKLVETGLPHPGISVTADGIGSGMFDMSLTTVWQEWMSEATFSIDSEVHGCANCIKNIEGIGEEWLPLAQTDFVQRSYFPELIYVTPYIESPKIRHISARAYVDFPVNKIVIYPDYRNNTYELGKIIATIDSVKNDPDIIVRSLHIAGTASPEGSYENNVYLAKNRTEALKNYVQNLYKFPEGFISTSYQPVDWKGLEEFLTMVKSLESGNNSQLSTLNPQGSIRADQFQHINYDPATIGQILPNATEILSIVKGDLPDVERNNKIKTTYPDQYAWLLANVYPALRHSDYVINFEVKNYTTVEEITEVMLTAPQKLSLNELFQVADSEPAGSELQVESFEIAVRLFPSDETANLNAAVNAIGRGDLTAAQRYLDKAGDTAEARYAKGLLLLQQGNQAEALEIFRELSGTDNETVAAKSAAALQGIEEVTRLNSRNFITFPEGESER